MAIRHAPELPTFVAPELDLHGEDLPVTRWTDGSYRIGGSRVLLYLVAQGIASGMSASELVAQLPSLQLANVECVADFCHRYAEEVDEFVRVVSAQGDEILSVVEAYQREFGAGTWPKR